jgi:ribulose-phosphate 3-epimerase
VVEAVRRCTHLPLDVHLMIDNPDSFLKDFVSAGADILTVHAEILPHLHRTIESIRELEAHPGVVLNPSTPLGVLDHILADVDMVLLMSVNPGFGGQSFIPESLNKARRLRSMIDERGLRVLIEIDGGIKVDNIAEAAAAGVDVFVSGSGIFSAPDYKTRMAEMRTAAEKGRLIRNQETQ